jgi:hypothetical protein
MAVDDAAATAQAQLQGHLPRGQHGGREDRRLLPALRDCLQEGQFVELFGHNVEPALPTEKFYRNAFQPATILLILAGQYRHHASSTVQMLGHTSYTKAFKAIHIVRKALKI